MPTLDIEGKKIKVDDSFLQMSTDQQHAAVDEIAKSLKGGAEKPAEGFSDRLQKVWDNPTPGGAIWLAKQAVDGIRGSVDSAKAATMQNPSTEEDFENIHRGTESLPHFTAQAASVLAPGAPKGSGGIFGAAERAAPGAARAPVPAPAVPAASPTEGLPVLRAAERLSDATGTDVGVPRAIASDSTAVQRAGQGVRNIPLVGDAIPKATQNLTDNLSGATRNIADQYGSGSGPNVASRIGRTLGDAAESETTAATDAARQSDETVRAAWQRDVDAAHQNVAGRETGSLEAARTAVGDMSPQDMGATLIDRLRTSEQSARATKDALYDRAGNADASIRIDEVHNARPYIVERLENAGVVIDPELTPAANRMLDEVQRISQLNIPNRAQLPRPAAPGDERVGVTVQGIEQARKRLVSIRQAANNDADRRAARLVMERFDDWQSHAFENALLSGDDQALGVFRQARAANTEWRQRFFNEEEDAGRVINRIVTGEVTPQEVANYIVGAGQVGAKGVSARLLARIEEATGNDPEALQAINGGIWNRLSQSTEGTAPKAPAAMIKDIMEFLNGSGRAVAERRFTPDQRRLMRAYADTLRTGQDARQLIGEMAETTRPGATPVQPGPMKQLADAVIGKGRKSDEALFSAVDAYAKSGSRGDVATLAKLVRAIPQEDRTDLAGAIIRNIGVSPRTGQFSPDVFVSQWNSYTPQAKAILFGNAGTQRQALDDIALISSRLKEVGSKFGNPSGTAQNVNMVGLGSALATAGTSLVHGDIVTPIAILGSVLGGTVVAKVLAAPASASSAAKWASAYEKLITKPTAASLSLFRIASRNLAGTAKEIGVKASPNDFIRALQLPDSALRSLQGPTPARAEDEKS